MDKTRVPGWLFTAGVLIAALAVAFYIRVVLPYDTVFAGPWIKLTGIDAYYYMRLVDNLVRNFPHSISFDPYYIYPVGSGGIHFFALMMAGIIKLLGGAAPSQQVVDTIAVYVPPVMGALTVIPAFFIGRLLINRWAGLVAAVAVAVMPGEFLNRSLLGFTDHHITEIFFPSYFAMFFMLAIHHSRQFTYQMLVKGNFPPFSRHIPYSFIAGIFMGFYLISWRGSLIFLFIVLVFFTLQFISDHLRGFPTDHLSMVAITCFLIALLIYLPFSRDRVVLLSLAAVILVPIALNILSTVLAQRHASPPVFIVVIAGLIALGILAGWFLFKDVFQSAAGDISRVITWKTEQRFIGEDKSLFLPGGTFSLDLAWQQYGLALYTGLIGLLVLAWQAVKKGSAVLVFMVVWVLVVMLAAFGMVRFSAYFGFCLAVLIGYLAGSIIQAIYPGRQPAAADRPRKKGKKKAGLAKAQAGKTAVAMAVVVAFLVTLAPGAALAVNQAKTPTHAPPDAWMEALDWLRANSPEPFGSADYYYARDASPDPGKAYEYPTTFYSVVAWSDYGYWITRIGRRVPNTNPGTDRVDAALYFTAQDESGQSGLMDQARARYVIIDDRIANPNDKFYALANLSGKKESDFYELCWQQKGGKYVPLLVFYPEYYRSMVIRLYNFDGKQVSPASTMVMSWQDRQTAQGDHFKEITALKSFRSVSEAETYIASQKQGNYRIIGTDPLASPVPLQALNQYRSVYQSKQKASVGSATQLPAIKIFEYTPAH